jgi:hypothetical protein
VGIFLCCMEEENPQKYIMKIFHWGNCKESFCCWFLWWRVHIRENGWTRKILSSKKCPKTDKNVSKIKERKYI